ncbi:cupin domain-containing protein [Desulfosporosinus fructosivorans]|uniref:Cupin domain-containing protein n=1 Tax=Desulfosporosinus fructosivorans TaxID=2018669 RepID=A0A4Z0R4P6_9FIRM|nr:cupin domain-containing protein [Desulfosporosinus fructosivorans]TGE37133.1 cupin domain-containing protein [Desulfosporosinus fructosivorans]
MILTELKNPGNNVFFDGTNSPNPKVSFGHIVFQPGDRIPKEGYGIHAQDEYSFVIRGTAHSVVKGVEQTLSAGMAAFIPAGEEHFTYNDGKEPFEVVYALVER